MATSSVSGVNKVGDNYYRTKVTDQGDGTFTSTLFRTDAQGANEVPISGYATPQGGGSVAQSINTTNATAEEQRLLADPNSQLNQTRKNQVKSTESDFFGNAGGSPSQQSQLDKAAGGSGNAAKTAPQSGSTANPSGGSSGSGSSDQTRNEFPNLRYPEDIGSTKQDIIKFSMLKYIPGGLNSSGGGEGLGTVGSRPEIGKRSPIGTVILPIPSGISDTNSVQWGSENMNAAEAFAAQAALTTIKQGFAAGANVVGEATAQVANDPATNKDVKTGFAAAFAAAATGTNGSAVLARTEGAVLNPNMELLFQGPALRPFSFTFKMSARSKEEAKQIIGIIRFFKQGMAVQKSKSNLFLKAPHTFRIQYIHRPKGENADHPYIGKIKECALQSLTVNYTPEGQYATYRDGVLVSYEMQMSFQELEPIFNEDSGKGTGSGGPDTDLGY